MAVIKLSEAKVNFIKDVCKSYGNKPGEVINVLHKVQGEYGYLPAEVQELWLRNWASRFRESTASFRSIPSSP